jgi:hypothetical protein
MVGVIAVMDVYKPLTISKHPHACNNMTTRPSSVLFQPLHRYPVACTVQTASFLQNQVTANESLIS